MTGGLEGRERAHKDGAPSISTTDYFEYDHANRLLSLEQRINDARVAEVIVENTYDNLGQLVGKGVGGKANQSRLQDVDYSYNIRGWLKNINDPDNLGTDLFGFGISYNTANHGAAGLFNGNISETEWRTANTDNSLHWYSYDYDALNRLTNATDNLGKLNETVSYDKNGNITSLLRLGHIVGGTTVPDINNLIHFGTMDNLMYTYVPNENKLRAVVDSGHDIYGFKDGADQNIEYTYDTNGNLITDANKGIIRIEYNHLNLPTNVVWGSEGNIRYIYDAKGTKLRKEFYPVSDVVIMTDYAGNYIYSDGSEQPLKLKFFNHLEGYAEPIYSSGGTGGDPFATPTISGFNYIYQYKDHLGNIRLSYSDTNGNGTIEESSEIVEENNYYPFGLEHKGYNNTVSANSNSVASGFKFGGKELSEELGLNTYDFGARNYMPDLGRWSNIDLLADAVGQIHNSPYAYGMNNPIVFTDPDGNCPPGVDCWSIVKSFIFNDTGKGKPVLTLGLHHIKLPTAERTEGDFVGNVVKAAYNGVAGTWNAGMNGADMGQITDEGMASMGDMARRIENGEGTVEDAENIVAGAAMMVVRGKVKGKGNKPSVKDQALDVKKNLNDGKNSVNVGTVNGTTHFDLDGATHKGVETPHVQKSVKNTNPNTGKTYINKDNKNVRPMTQQDIRTVKKVLEKRKENNN